MGVSKPVIKSLISDYGYEQVERNLDKQIFEEGKEPALEEKRFKEEAIRCFSDIIREKEKLQLPQFREEDFRDSEIKRIYNSLLHVDALR
ncbi:hypothetical protein [Fictibacillus terranigra]|uniref:Uncharacterized protein n=1 Tax=Fictibacillus terranigra TaxID=3058424 RepID=A0ABT8E8Y0_9BACL|nr:hypothetical protein [Fictibacillus sp. CENA-BCM004]MDN4074361.1 hypothetical protein [Fictibacillus sp. CENA-BCM004]